ncbi:methyltransferase family protein [Haloactinopolyspora alba]|uniref:Methyltransferase family protein n=1 Tax=Haloactinopolyspora alba TaxID=648780 RepID=A0A2P8E0V8_9ACTN|nr:class I SAM-dependent methyltransferase [Haloactinopolyspora alba]PSL03100.1 methyltransferase family protein [Haloactinopolyspora alba]
MTSRQLTAVAAAAVLGLLVAVAGLAGSTDLAVGGLGLLLAGIFVVLMDVRRRQGEVARRLRDVARQQSRDAGKINRLKKLPDKVGASADEAARSLSTAFAAAADRVEAAGEKAATGIAQERLAAAERHVRLVDEFGRVHEEIIGVRGDLGGVRADLMGARDDVRDGVDRVRGTVTDVRDATVAKIDEAEQAGKRRQVMIREHIARLEYEPVRQVQALLQLVERVDARAPLPQTGGWAMEPTTLLRLVNLVERERPAMIVECGSGASTVWLAYAVRALGAGRVVALEHDERFAAETRRLLDEHGLSEVAEVRTAALTDLELGRESFVWYDRDAVADIKDIELLVVDGPPRSSGPQARYPAVPVLAPVLAPGAKIVVDDVDRSEEQEATEAWLAQTPGLTREGEPVDRAAMLTYRPA